MVVLLEQWGTTQLLEVTLLHMAVELVAGQVRVRAGVRAGVGAAHFLRGALVVQIAVQVLVAVLVADPLVVRAVL